MFSTLHVFLFHMFHVPHASRFTCFKSAPKYSLHTQNFNQKVQEGLLQSMKTEKSMKFTDLDKHQYQLYPHDIYYVKADNIRSWLICENQAIHISYPILFMEELLPDYFLRIHRSFLINQNSITALYYHTIIINNEFCLPVPEKKYQWLKSYLENAGLSNKRLRAET